MDPTATAPPTLTGLSTYLLSLTGKAARGRLAERLAARGLRLWHMAVLAALADLGPHVQRDLCTRLSVDPSDMAKIVDQLTTLGHVDRARDAADRRRVVVAITSEGREALESLVREAESVQDEILAPLSPEERTQLHALLLRVFAQLQEPRAVADERSSSSAIPDRPADTGEPGLRRAACPSPSETPPR